MGFLGRGYGGHGPQYATICGYQRECIEAGSAPALSPDHLLLWPVLLCPANYPLVLMLMYSLLLVCHILQETMHFVRNKFEHENISLL